MATPATPLRLYYDVISPYSWVAFEVLCRYKARWNIDLDLQPFYLGGIMGGSGNVPPGTNPVKARYMIKDLKRLNSFYGIPLQVPSNIAEVMFQKGSLFPQRFLTAAKEDCPTELEELSRQLWLRVWSRDEDIVSPDSLRLVYQKVGLSEELGENLISLTAKQSVKDKLKQTTQEALNHGAFGAPFIVVEVGGRTEEFFGTDRFELIANTIGEKWEGPLLQQQAKY